MAGNPMTIRKETEKDIQIIERLTYAAFENHPHHAPGQKPMEHLIVNELRAMNALTLSLVYEEEGELLGHIAFSPVLINGEESGWLGLGPVSVLPNQQGKGIGSKLINEGLKQLKASGTMGVVLLGEPSYYQRFGFEQSAILTCEGVPEEYFLVTPLAKEVPKGNVSYHEAFFKF